jgi:hypothetical protein
VVQDGRRGLFCRCGCRRRRRRHCGGCWIVAPPACDLVSRSVGK